MQIDMAGTSAWHRESEANHLMAIESAHHLSAHFIGHDEHAQRNQLSIGKVPDFFLQSDAGAQLIEAPAVANQNSRPTHECRSCCLACRQRDSSSSIVAPSKLVPF